jgi:7-cyano-7-deazaguanine synthase in queuosine biosynthesis
MKQERQSEDRIRLVTVEVYEPGSRPRHADYTCRIGRDLVIDPERIGRFCLRELEPIVDDLVLIAGAVAYTDRVVARQPSIAWRRDLHVAIPVHDPDRWKDPALYRQLIGTLDYVTGDMWTISFKHRQHRTPVTLQPLLSLPSEGALVIPFSDGLDSFAVSRLIAADHPNTPLILVTIGRHKNRALDRCNASLGKAISRVAIPFHLSQKRRRVRFREASYRSRAFVFGVIAGIAAYQAGASTIYVAESGQGSLGPWLRPVGNEAPDVRMHPSFSSRLSAFLSLVFGRTMSHLHPQLWHTKGETLRMLAERELADEWWRTSSCARDQRHVFQDDQKIQCGVCAGCLLRRQSLFAADLASEHERYLWDNLRVPTLNEAVEGRTTTPNDVQQALCAVLEMQGFGDMLSQPEQIRTAAEDLAPFVDLNAHAVETNLTRLISAHASEWKLYRETLGSESFINRWLDVLK